ncbi:MAG TPA: alpha/beta fold hydrolase [Steroidobacteraceae bacterium]
MAGRALNQPAGTFNPPRLLRSSHLQSTLGSVPPRSWLIRSRAAAVLAASRELLLDCGDGVRLQAFHTPPRPEMALLLHGWEGSAESPYVLSAAALLFARGFAVARLNLRDHGKTHALNRELFHSCRLPEIVGAVRALSAQFPGARLYLGGFSLGGNFLLRVASQPRLPASVAGVVAVSPVLDPEVTLTALERGLPVYRRYFIQRWSRSLRSKQKAWPGVHDFRRLSRYADLRRMTAELVERCTYFATLEAYLQGYGVTGPRLASLAVPAYILLAADDPMIPADDLDRVARSDRLTVVRTRYGGHCGFMDHWAGPSYADRFMLAQFQQL